MLAVHELNERQPSHFNRSFIQQTTATDPLSIEQIKENDFVSIQQPAAIDLSTSQPMILPEQQSNLKPQDIVSSAIAINQRPDIPIAQRKTTRKARRSIKARKRRNQKTSLRHRRNRYRFQLQRPTNMDVTTVKNILHKYNIKCTNINLVQSITLIGVNSQQQQQQQLYDQLLQIDIFQT